MTDLSGTQNQQSSVEFEPHGTQIQQLLSGWVELPKKPFFAEETKNKIRTLVAQTKIVLVKFIPQKRQRSDEMIMREAITAQCAHDVYDLCDHCKVRYADMKQPGMTL